MASVARRCDGTPGLSHRGGVALADAGPSAIPAIDEALAGTLPDSQLAVLATTLGRIGGPAAVQRIDELLDHRDGVVRASAFAALLVQATTGAHHSNGVGPPVDAVRHPRLMACLAGEVANIEHLTGCIGAIPEPDALALAGALRAALVRSVANLVALAVVLAPDPTRAASAYRLLTATDAARLPEVIDLLDPELSSSVRPMVIPVIERLARPRPPGALEPSTLARLITGAGAGAESPTLATDPWTRATVCHLAGARRAVSCRAELEAASDDEDHVVRESARWAITSIDDQEEPAMFTTVDKVLALKRVSLFAHTPDDVLAAVAQLVREEAADTGSVIVREGEPGEEMYVIASGRVDVQRGGHVLNGLGDGDVFGEMAVLDPGPRSATVIALEPTHLLVLDQAPLHDLLAATAGDRVGDHQSAGRSPSGSSRGTRAGQRRHQVTLDHLDLDAAIDYARRRLTAELADDLTYHDVAHTANWVVPAAVRLAKESDVDGVDLALVVTAAWFHDLGYIEQYSANEPIGARIAGEALPMFGYRAEQVRAVQAMILATIVPQRPEGILEQLVADADLDILARPDMLDRNERLRAELARYTHPVSDVEWYASQLRFFDAHQYFTAAAKRTNDAAKAKNRAILSDLLESARTA